jgi:uncharacterized protein
MGNPFQFGRVVEKKQFCNRKKELYELSICIRNSKSLWLYSPRHTGKTSLILKTFSQIREVKTIYFSLFKVRNINEFANRLLNAYSRELLNDPNDITSILKQLSNHLRNISVSLDAKRNPVVGIELKTNEISETLKSILDLPEKLNYSKPIFIAFDEFQEIERIDPNLKNLMNKVFQKQMNINYIFMGCKESTMKTIFSNAELLFFRSVEELELAKISSIDLALFIHAAFKESKLKIKQETIDDVLEISECHPHYTQYAAYFAWELINRKIPQDEHFDQLLLSRIIQSQSHLFHTIYEQLNANQRKVLNALSDPKMRNILSDRTMKKYSLPPKSTVSTALNSLLQKTLILKENGIYKFENPIFRIWINRLYDYEI